MNEKKACQLISYPRQLLKFLKCYLFHNQFFDFILRMTNRLNRVKPFDKVKVKNNKNVRQPLRTSILILRLYCNVDFARQTEDQNKKHGQKSMKANETYKTD